MERSQNPIAVVVASLVAAVLLISIAPIRAQQDEGWTTLFDGTALGHWNPIGDANWALARGMVEATRGKGFLVSRASYSDFQLQADVWINDGANSGVFFRCVDPKNISAVSCYEVNIEDNRPATMRTGAIVNVAKANVVVNVANQWTTIDITAEGKKLTASVNGLVVSSGQDTAHAAGPIALERSAGTVRVRRVRIRPLSPTR
jgi:hypothetical protein